MFTAAAKAEAIITMGGTLVFHKLLKKHPGANFKIEDILNKCEPTINVECTSKGELINRLARKFEKDPDA